MALEMFAWKLRHVRIMFSPFLKIYLKMPTFSIFPFVALFQVCVKNAPKERK